MERIVFVVALCLLSFGYGVATMQFEVFPHKLLKQAKLGWEAWASMETEKRAYPNHFERFEPGAAAAPQAKRLAEGAGDELVLVSGGPYQLLERCPKWGCMAWIAERTGKIVHTWEVDLEALWSGLTGVSGDVNRLSLYPVGMLLGEDGSLVVSFQGRETYPVHIGIIKLDRGGKILWKRFDRSHHWPAMDAAGRIYTPASTIRELKQVGSSGVGVKCATGQSIVDAIRILDPQGEPVRELPLLEPLVRAGYAGLFYGLRDGCNPTHLNSIALASPEVARRIPGAAEGDYLVSLRETSTVALLDRETAAVKYAVSGRSAAQHSAQFLPDGSVLALDNLGGERGMGGTRVVRIDLVTGAARTVFPKDSAQGLLPVKSETAGQINVSADGKRALVSITHQGRIVEIDVESGTPLWVYENTHDIQPFLKEAGLRSQTTRARFATYGAYYVQGNFK